MIASLNLQNLAPKTLVMIMINKLYQTWLNFVELQINLVLP